MITRKRHADDEPQPSIVARRHSANEVRISLSRTSVAGSHAVLEVDRGQVRLLPGNIGMKLEVADIPVRVDQLRPAYVEAQVAERGGGVAA